MKKTIFIICIGLLFFNCKNNENRVVKNNDSFGIVIHGGAGTILKKNMSDSLETAYKNKLKEAITKGHTILKNGGTAIDAVTATINIMEDSPLFNSGRGAVFTHDETNELDASIMDGKTLNAGAVAGVKHIKNPINLALAVMNDSPHVLLSGEGAEEFAKKQGFQLLDASYFYTEKRYKSLQRIKEKTKKNNTTQVSFEDPFIKNSKFGTVGCAALDKEGNLAAGTSTGGMTNKRWNRIGDSPIIGAGTYANNKTCAVSSTGWGEYFIRAVVAHDISAMMEYKGITLKEAAKEVIQNKLTALGGDGGIIAIDKNGSIVTEFNTAGMYRAQMNATGELVVEIYSNSNKD